ncbi:hypothetical protein HDU76_005487 [Blyttiomyces sp. JEL0837]|nr:hypothetical protein HDU76_005487 [Blyttiomyces sp. JEL0837]
MTTESITNEVVADELVPTMSTVRDLIHQVRIVDPNDIAEKKRLNEQLQSALDDHTRWVNIAAERLRPSTPAADYWDHKYLSNYWKYDVKMIYWGRTAYGAMGGDLKVTKVFMWIMVGYREVAGRLVALAPVGWSPWVALAEIMAFWALVWFISSVIVGPFLSKLWAKLEKVLEL